MLLYITATREKKFLPVERLLKALSSWTDISNALLVLT